MESIPGPASASSKRPVTSAGGSRARGPPSRLRSEGAVLFSGANRCTLSALSLFRSSANHAADRWAEPGTAARLGDDRSNGGARDVTRDAGCSPGHQVFGFPSGMRPPERNSRAPARRAGTRDHSQFGGPFRRATSAAVSRLNLAALFRRPRDPEKSERKFSRNA